MNQPKIETLVQRLDDLERENRRLKWIGALVLIGIAALVLMGQAGPRRVFKHLQSEQFILQDPGGQTRAVLGTLADGSSGLVLYDRNGKERAKLIVLADGSSVLHALDKDGKLRAGLGVASDGSPGLLLGDREGRPRAGLSVLGDGMPSFGLFDANGKVLFKAP